MILNHLKLDDVTNEKNGTNKKLTKDFMSFDSLASIFRDIRPSIDTEVKFTMQYLFEYILRFCKKKK